MRGVDAFIDESSRETPGGLCYVIAAAVTIDNHPLVRATMERLCGSNRPFLHWHTEDTRRRHQIVEQLTAAVDVHAFVAACHPVGAKRQERARARLLTTLAADLAHEGVDHMVIEARQEPQNQKDRSTLLAAKQAGIAAAMTYSHVGKRMEPLLWVADVIAGAVSLHLTGDDSSYFTQLQPSLLVVRQIEPRP